jgi:hypothetical protein
MSINRTTGQIRWLPIQGQEGWQYVSIEVNDSETPIYQNFSILVHPLLIVNITNPINGQRIFGKLEIKGIYIGPRNATIELVVDNTIRVILNASNSWSYNISTWDLDNGNHTIIAKAVWNKYQSNEVNIKFKVNNRKSTYLDSHLFAYIFLFIIVISFLLVIYYELKLRNNSKSNHKRKKIGHDFTKPQKRMGKLH